MQNPDSTLVVARFFECLDYLKEHRIIRGKATFMKRYGINRMNAYKLEKDMTSDMFQTSWLTYLVRDYHVSPLWLLTGEGTILSDQ